MSSTDGNLKQIPVMVAGLREIQELHKPVSYWYVVGYDETLYDSKADAEKEAEGNRVSEFKVCGHCMEPGDYETVMVSHPCPTRQLADKALGETS